MKAKVLEFASIFYVISTLSFMGGMSVGALVFAAALLFALGGPQGVWREWRTELQNPVSRKYLYLALFLTAACLISLIGGMLFPWGYDGNFVEVHLFKDMAKAWYLLWPLLLALGFRKLPESSRRRVVVSWFLVFALMSALGVIQYFTGWPRPQPIPGLEARYHATLFLGHHLSVASILIFPFFASLDFLFRRQPPIPRGALLAGVVLGGFTLMATYSRTLWVALPLGILAWILWNLSRKWSWTISGISILAMLLATQSPAVQNRLGDSFGWLTRKELWLANIEFFKARPLTGIGWRHNHEMSGYYFLHIRPGQPYFGGHAHNNFLDMLGGTGLLGALSWLLWSGGVLYFVWLSRKSDHPMQFARGLVCAWVVFHINGLTQLNFWEGKVQHQTMLMVSVALLWHSSRGTVYEIEAPKA